MSALLRGRDEPRRTPPVPATVAGREVHQTAAMRRSTLEMLPRVADWERNFDPDRREEYLAEGWHVDHHEVQLGREQAGPPTGDGVFATARELVRAYEHVDPALVRAAWWADAELAGRDMVLEGRFGPLRFPMALRIGGVRDEVGEVDGREVHRWGWWYETLEQHLERGRMDFEVRKGAGDGVVSFHIDAWSHRADLDNPVLAVGMLLFGRSMQHVFGHAALGRMAAFTRG